MCALFHKFSSKLPVKLDLKQSEKLRGLFVRSFIVSQMATMQILHLEMQTYGYIAHLNFIYVHVPVEDNKQVTEHVPAVELPKYAQYMYTVRLVNCCCSAIITDHC